MLNDLLSRLDLAAWKPLLTALLLPPAPFVLLMLVGAWLTPRRGRAGWCCVWVAAMGIWFGSTEVVGEALQQALLGPVPALRPETLRQLARSDLPDTNVAKQARPVIGARKEAKDAIVVLGGGRDGYAAEYADANLNPYSLARLRYGLWLARETGLPVAYSGGVGHTQPAGVSEAAVAARIADREFGQRLQWIEGRSRDTRENAALMVAVLRPAGVTRIVLVTHGWHMRRSLRAFEQAIDQQGGGIGVLAAPMGVSRDSSLPAMRWLPTIEGFSATRLALREMLGLLGGA